VVLKTFFFGFDEIRYLLHEYCTLFFKIGSRREVTVYKLLQLRLAIVYYFNENIFSILLFLLINQKANMTSRYFKQRSTSFHF